MDTSISKEVYMYLNEINELIQSYMEANVKSILPNEDELNLKNITDNQNFITYISDELEIQKISTEINNKMNDFQLFIQNFNNIEMIFYAIRNYYLSLQMKTEDKDNTTNESNEETDINDDVTKTYDDSFYTNPKIISTQNIPNDENLYGHNFLNK